MISDRRSSRWRGVTAALAFFTAVHAPLLAQDYSGQLIRDAVSQLRAGNLDSADALVRFVLTPGGVEVPDERAAALVLRGVLSYYRGRDGETAKAFNEALRVRPTLREEWLYQVDPSLWALWRGEQARVLCGTGDVRALVFLGPQDTTPPSELTESPRITSSPRINYPTSLREQGMAGHVLAAVLIDTAGRVVRDSVRIVESTHLDFSREVRRYVSRAGFAPARSNGEAVRACVIVPVDFRLKRP